MKGERNEEKRKDRYHHRCRRDRGHADRSYDREPARYTTGNNKDALSRSANWICPIRVEPGKCQYRCRRDFMNL